MLSNGRFSRRIIILHAHDRTFMTDECVSHVRMCSKRTKSIQIEALFEYVSKVRTSSSVKSARRASIDTHPRYDEKKKKKTDQRWNCLAENLHEQNKKRSISPKAKSFRSQPPFPSALASLLRLGEDDRIVRSIASHQAALGSLTSKPRARPADVLIDQSKWNFSFQCSETCSWVMTCLWTLTDCSADTYRKD